MILELEKMRFPGLSEVSTRIKLFLDIVTNRDLAKQATDYLLGLPYRPSQGDIEFAGKHAGLDVREVTATINSRSVEGGSRPGAKDDESFGFARDSK